MVHQDPISKEEWLAWIGHRVTQQICQGLFETREGLQEGLAENQASTEFDRAIIVGRCQALKDALDYILKDFDYDGRGQPTIEETP